jgi:hypothetical protein
MHRRSRKCRRKPKPRPPLPPVPPRLPSMPTMMTLALPSTRPNTNPPSPPLQKQHDPTAPPPTRVSPPPNSGAGTRTKLPSKKDGKRCYKREQDARTLFAGNVALGLGRSRSVFGLVIYLFRSIFLCLCLWSLFIHDPPVISLTSLPSSPSPLRTPPNQHLFHPAKPSPICQGEICKACPVQYTASAEVFTDPCDETYRPHQRS